MLSCFEGEAVHPTFFANAHAVHGWALAREGQYTAGVAELESALADGLRIANYVLAVIAGALLAELCAHLPPENDTDYDARRKTFSAECSRRHRAAASPCSTPRFLALTSWETANDDASSHAGCGRADGAAHLQREPVTTRSELRFSE
jgi:hypothetical protein